VVIDALQIQVSTDTVVAGHWRNLFLTEWRARATAADLAANYELQVALIRRLPPRAFVSFAVVPGAVIRPVDPELRKVIDSAVPTIHPHTRATALVLPAGGFAGAIIRSVLTSLNFIRRLDFPNKIFATVPSALGFLAQHVDGAPTLAELEAVHRDLLAAPPRRAA
jgi:hypothetical protein